MTATSRDTPSFTPVQTQNTAPVHEFRCLFTHDAHKKAKKWHDGSVRFHTFNRRVMVYDDGKNYIGDNHYGHDEFGEGVELRTDRNVLVEVGERLGETQTDVSSILDRRKDDASPQPTKNIRLVAAASQHESKSISQILGTQPRIGRARALPSPYQQRQALAPVQPVERPMPPPSKRQRIDVSQQENRPPSPLQVEKPAPKVAKQVKPQLPKPRPVPKKDPVLDFQEVLDLSSDEELAKSARRPLPKTKKTLIKMKPTAEEPQSTSEKEATSTEKTTYSRAQGRAQSTKQHISSEAAASIGQPTRRQHQSVPQLLNRAKTSQPGTSSRSGQTQLRLCSPPPRRKLLYRALLPSSEPQSGSGAPSPHGSQITTPRRPSLAGSSPAKMSPRESAFVTKPSSSRQGPRDEPPEVLSSPLFVPDDRHHTSPSPSPQLSQDSLEASLLGRPCTSPEDIDARERSPQLSQAASPMVSDVDQHAPKTSDSPEQYPAKQRQMLPPPLPQPVQLQTSDTPTPRSRPFRRVRSENDAFHEAEDDFSDFDGFSVLPPSFLAKAKASPARVFRSPQKSPARLRRTASDSAIMDDSDGRALGYNVELILEDFEETGPWTTAEAYLLFEWWPPGKKKPGYGAPAYTELDSARCGPGRVTITTARDMLRDEMNVL